MLDFIADSSWKKGTEAGSPERVELAIAKFRGCPICGHCDPYGTIRDEISEKEFSITGMCQACQDRIFGS